MVLRALDCREACNAWVGQLASVGQSSFANAVGVPTLLRHQEPVGGDAQTGVVMIDGQFHVFDWHATLAADNPMLFKSVAGWLGGRGGTPLAEFKGFA